MSKDPSEESKSGSHQDRMSGDAQVNDEWIDEGNDDAPMDEEEFSLDQLSQAYAEVLKSQADEGRDDSSEGSERELASSDAESELLERPDSESEEPRSDDNAACLVSPESIIESILFVGTPQDVTLTSRKIAAVLRDVSAQEVTSIVRQLNAKYEKEDSAYRIESNGGVFKMVLASDLIEFQQDFFGRNRQFRLSQAAIDVMAIVAYNQPTTREQVEKTRGKPSGSILSQLVRREILKVEPGEANPRIRYYSTGDRFLELFGLAEIADLPQSHEISDIDELVD